MISQWMGESIKVLLVEDNPGDIRLMREVLKDSKIKNSLSVVNNGEEAVNFLYRKLAYIDAPKPDLIILDWNLPVKSGYEVLKEIKRDYRLKDIPTIVFSSSAAQDDIIKAYGAHANCYITKPADYEQFFKVINLIEEFWMNIVNLPRR